MPRGAARREVEIEEYGSAIVPRADLSTADVQRLRDLKAVTLSERRNHWLLTARTLSGVLELSRVRLILRPKLSIAGNRLIDWLAYANGQNSTPDEELRNWRLGRDGYAGLVPAALLHECRLLLHRGLRRDYVPRQRVESTLRGRLNVEAQATRCFGGVAPLHVRTFEYESACWENLVCGAALTVASRRVSDPLLRHRLAATAAEFPAPSRSVDPMTLLLRGQYSALNAHYRSAHAWARVVLGGGGPDDLLHPYGFGAQGLLLKLDDLWESVVRRMAVEAAVGAGGRRVKGSGHEISTNGGLEDTSQRPFNPDVLLSFGPAAAPPEARRYLVVDAKYKDYVRTNVSRHDRHQLLTYIAGYADPSNPVALVVHPAEHGPTDRQLEVRGPRGLVGLIRVLGLDTRSDPGRAAGPLREAIAEFARSGPRLPGTVS